MEILLSFIGAAVVEFHLKLFLFVPATMEGGGGGGGGESGVAETFR